MRRYGSEPSSAVDGVQGLERALDRGAVGGGLRSQEANPRQRDIEGAEPPAPSPIDEVDAPRRGARGLPSGRRRLASRPRAPRGCAARTTARCADARASASARSRRTRGRGEVAVRELRRAEERGGLHPREHASALFRELDGTAAVGERAGQITPQAQHLAQERVRSVEGLECVLALLGEESSAEPPRPRRCAPGVRSPAPTRRGTGRVRWSARPPPAGRQPRATSVSARSSGRTGGSEAADRKLGVGQHGAHLELEHRRRILRRAPSRAPRTRGTGPRRPRARTGARRT